MAETTPTPQPAAPAAKPRNPVEKLLVRGFIAAALVLIAVEANSWWQQKSVLDALLPKLKLIEVDAKAPAVTEADVKKAVGGKEPDKEKSTSGLNTAVSHFGASRMDVYSWFTISPVNKREMYVYYGKAGKHDKDGPEVLSIQTDNEPPPKVVSEKVAGGDQPAPAAGGPGMMGGGPGMMGGGPGMMGGGPGEAPPAHAGPQGAGEPGAVNKDGDKPGEEKATSDATDENKPSDDKSDDAKPGESSGDAKSE